MKRSRFTEEQVTYALKLAEQGTPVKDVCRQFGIAEATFYVWRKKYAGLGLTEVRELRHLREENGRLKKLVADLTLDKHILGAGNSPRGSIQVSRYPRHRLAGWH